MKVYAALAIFAFAVLAAFAVWFGGLNQDEGWYLYAAQLVGEGKMLYRDFAFTQGPHLPKFYKSFAWVWADGRGLLGARIFTATIGLVGMMLAAGLARMLAGHRSVLSTSRSALSTEQTAKIAGVIAFLLLGCNLYHIYYTAIPKTYALAQLWVMMGFCLLANGLAERSSAINASPDGRTASPDGRTAFGHSFLVGAGMALGYAAGTRISLGILLAVCGVGLLLNFKRFGWSFLWFGLGGALTLALVYGPFLLDAGAREGLVAAQRYHAARGGFDAVFTVGSLSRLVRWYLPVFVLLGLGLAEHSSAIFTRSSVLFTSRSGLPMREDGQAVPDQSATRNFLLWLMGLGFLAVFAVQMMAPHPYEDYQVPVMGLLAVVAAVLVSELRGAPLLALGLAWGCSFGSPLLEQWMTNGQDRFWTLKKEKSELAQLRDAARLVEALDPGGKTLFTQDTYLAVETGRRVPDGLEMGPFSILTDDAWRALIDRAECPVAALSGYTFAINPPVCDERPFDRQMDLWSRVKTRYDRVTVLNDFGQHATPLLILKRKAAAE
ncbi:MAG: hypothetical protein IJ173_07340 [Kiritimatiellae bacterium]|nr:hypothetical protein [Kiritimatiellia bacterium]